MGGTLTHIHGAAGWAEEHRDAGVRFAAAGGHVRMIQRAINSILDDIPELAVTVLG